ncbi:hypothetical protein MVES1_003360 [Malassezia vespertilionis]|uniref:DUF1751-domain-containing protein n=1 Tax=Malassezia vespertilionis TaxID=2020962 RepID=A0A2N1J772_9BASI|nr:uncharacterized protein MVES1_003360 [Malassezia vespertilionis]PKI82407.1 hypothetical protein MVES_003602 [Malassezia vespertilionis]WFD07991.1 hypothetical protein MVES1_003360 [Malassezia vespertilionis]
MDESLRALRARATSLPVGARVLVGLLVAFSTLLAALRELGILQLNRVVIGSALHYPYLVLIPGASLWFPWTLVTAGFCETSVIEFAVSLATIPFAAQYLERFWGAHELLRFSVVIMVVSNVIAAFLSLLLYIVFQSNTAAFKTQFHGMQALQSAYLVAFAQRIPQHQLKLFSARFAISVRDLPMLYVGVSNVMCLLGYTSPWMLIQFGWLASWLYLRFYQLDEHGVRGDATEAFAFKYWFPSFVQPYVGMLADFVHGHAARLGLVRETVAYTDLELNVDEPAPLDAAGSGARAEAERRRALALEALDQRMANETDTSESPRSAAPIFAVEGDEERA